MARARLRGNQHFVWGNFGPPGSGKSEGALMLGTEVQGSRIDIRRQVAFKPSDRAKLAKALPKFRVVFDDEATGEGGHKRRGMSEANVDNIQDLDACRGRNQANSFCAPRLVDLDGIIQAHLMGYMEWNQDHSCEWFEAIRGGPQWAPTVYWESRFTVAEPPWLGEYFPDVRTEYLQAKDAHMAGRKVDRVDRVLLEDEMYDALASAFPPSVASGVVD